MLGGALLYIVKELNHPGFPPPVVTLLQGLESLAVWNSYNNACCSVDFTALFALRYRFSELYSITWYIQLLEFHN